MIYSNLQSRVAMNLDNRSDLTTYIQNWINDARKDIALEYDFDYLYVEATCQTSAGSATYAFPEDYLGHDILLLGTKKLVRITPREFENLRGLHENIDVTIDSATPYLPYYDSSLETDTPDYYLVRGMFFDLYPIPDGTYTLVIKYYSQPADFSEDSDEDYMSRFHPDIIVWNAALRGAVYLDDAKKQGDFNGLYNKALSQMMRREKDRSGKDKNPRMRDYREYEPTQLRRILKVGV